MEVLHYFGAAIALGLIAIGAGLGIGRLAAAAAEGARPLNYNHYKIPLMQNLVKRSLS